ncbi:helix-turn-helix domain-containing protein [Flavobacterium sp. 140616W15]|uniref:helix-turn-helix domain-containing protein n=1 Tax=Flavobacterium sp. 140616W15 TaxID=2478552 RepID=UPI000F0C4204|nr:helix-turn-helix domain-containing protein [Flavobacterium sp. 140616W15]AYN03776.1 transposase [Flavobacterium sp. 140616W15]AYN04139.1 transposase [Flavobacterium sp. 140616W15]AYN04498.1 transposase [Flavobacterium sp. 140616W15]AYN04757.1 transposase [Flavobacterium sp. 140616W15]AYN05137.1 transposase [Flavobacterium sp. 140616W15]
MERKVKYDYAFKLECVRLVIEKGYSSEAVSNEKSISESNIRRWVSFYRAYGTIGLLPRKNRVYSIDFKQKVLLSIDKDLLSLREARLKFNIPSDSIIIRWKRDFANFGLEGLSSKPKGRPRSMNFKRKQRKTDKPLTREEELLKELEYLRAENEILKKFNALVQAEQANQNKRLKP